MKHFEYNDGGRSKYFKGVGGDCVTRAISIASGRDYKEIYDMLAKGNATQRRGKYEKKSKTGKKTALNGINTKRKWFKDLMVELGFEWIPTMKIGEGCKVHLRPDELPEGRIICNVSKHFTAVIDGVINDTYDPSREGTRCVYGYWVFKGELTDQNDSLQDIEAKVDSFLKLEEQYLNKRKELHDAMEDKILASCENFDLNRYKELKEKYQEIFKKIEAPIYFPTDRMFEAMFKSKKKANE